MIINLKSKTDLSSFSVVYEGSTNLEKNGWWGIAHLMEHLQCKNFDHLQEEFDKDGIEYNAYTTSNEIVFYIQGLDEKVNKWKYKFMDLLGGFNTTKKDFEKERKIVLEEYSDSFNGQTEAHYLNLYRKLFNNYNPIGLRKDLEDMKYIDCLNFYELQYQNPTKIINVSKKYDYKNNLLNFNERKIINNLSFGNHEVDLELGNTYGDKSSLIMLSDVVKEDFEYVKFINSMLSFGLTSPLYKEIREKNGLVYYIHCHMTRIANNGLINIATQTSSSNVNKVINGVKKVLKKPDFINKDRFNTIMELYKVNKQKAEILQYENINDWVQPDEFSIMKNLDNITLKKVKEVYEKYYNFDNFYISDDKKEFLK